MSSRLHTGSDSDACARLPAGDLKQIGNVRDDICNPRKLMLMQKQTETKAFQNTGSALEQEGGGGEAWGAVGRGGHR